MQYKPILCIFIELFFMPILYIAKSYFKTINITPITNQSYIKVNVIFISWLMFACSSNMRDSSCSTSVGEGSVATRIDWLEFRCRFGSISANADSLKYPRKINCTLVSFTLQNILKIIL